jgi:hypothetical protein
MRHLTRLKYRERRWKGWKPIPCPWSAPGSQDILESDPLETLSGQTTASIPEIEQNVPGPKQKGSQPRFKKHSRNRWSAFFSQESPKADYVGVKARQRKSILDIQGLQSDSNPWMSKMRKSGEGSPCSNPAPLFYERRRRFRGFYWNVFIPPGLVTVWLIFNWPNQSTVEKIWRVAKITILF